MAYIPLPPHMEEALTAHIKRMYEKYKPQMISFNCTSKSPYGGDGSFYSEGARSTFVWEYKQGPYIVQGLGD